MMRVLFEGINTIKMFYILRTAFVPCVQFCDGCKFKSESDSDSVYEMYSGEHVLLEIMLIVSNLSSSFSGKPARKSLQWSNSND